MKKISLIAFFSVLYFSVDAQTANEKKPQLAAAEKSDSVTVAPAPAAAAPSSSASSEQKSQQVPKKDSNAVAAPELSNSGTPRRKE